MFTNLGYFYLAYTLAGFQTVSSSHLNLLNQHLTLISTKLLLPSLQNVLAHLFSPCYFMHSVFYSFLIYALLDCRITGSKIPSAHTFHFASALSWFSFPHLYSTTLSYLLKFHPYSIVCHSAPLIVSQLKQVFQVKHTKDEKLICKRTLTVRLLVLAHLTFSTT